MRWRTCARPAPSRTAPKARRCCSTCCPRRRQRVLDIGTGDGRLLALGAHGPTWCARGRDRLLTHRCSSGPASGSRPIRMSTVVEHDLDDRYPTSVGSTSSCRASRSTTWRTRASEALYGEIFERLDTGRVVRQPRTRGVAHARSSTSAFLRALDVDPADDDPSNILGARRAHSSSGSATSASRRWTAIWKWRELALLAGVKPR